MKIANSRFLVPALFPAPSTRIRHQVIKSFTTTNIIIKVEFGKVRIVHGNIAKHGIHYNASIYPTRKRNKCMIGQVRAPKIRDHIGSNGITSAQYTT